MTKVAGGFASGLTSSPGHSTTIKKIGDPATARGFLVNRGIGCEPATFGFLTPSSADGAKREWFWYCACKTQYAAIVSDAHLVFCYPTVVPSPH